MSALGELPVLLLADETQQLGREALGVIEDCDRNQVVIVSLKQLEALCGARDEEGFLFVVADTRRDQDREISVVVVGGLHVPRWSSSADGLRDGFGLL